MPSMGGSGCQGRLQQGAITPGYRRALPSLLRAFTCCPLVLEVVRYWAGEVAPVPLSLENQSSLRSVGLPPAIPAM